MLGPARARMMLERVRDHIRERLELDEVFRLRKAIAVGLIGAALLSPTTAGAFGKDPWGHKSRLSQQERYLTCSADLAEILMQLRTGSKVETDTWSWQKERGEHGGVMTQPGRQYTKEEAIPIARGILLQMGFKSSEFEPQIQGMANIIWSMDPESAWKWADNYFDKVTIPIERRHSKKQ